MTLFCVKKFHNPFIITKILYNHSLQKIKYSRRNIPEASKKHMYMEWASFWFAQKIFKPLLMRLLALFLFTLKSFRIWFINIFFSFFLCVLLCFVFAIFIFFFMYKNINHLRFFPPHFLCFVFFCFGKYFTEIGIKIDKLKGITRSQKYSPTSLDRSVSHKFFNFFIF